MSIGSVALRSGLAIGTATAIGSFIAHEKLEQGGQWTGDNSRLSTAMQLGAIGGSVVAMGAGTILRSNALFGVGGGILFGAQVGNLAGMTGAMLID